MRPVPEKGRPDFSMLDDKRVRDFRDFVNVMIGSYSFSPEKTAVLKEIWNDLTDESAARVCDMPEVEPSNSGKLKSARKTLLRNRKFRT